MRKTYITKMPDKAGAFLAASRAIAQCGGNIVRANYNKAVDAHALFIEVNASKEQHKLISESLESIKYLTDDPGMRQIILIELKLPDEPGTVAPVLEVIKAHEVNISYINSRENGTPYQFFKMGLLVEDSTEIKGLLDDISKLCEVHVLDYEASDRLLDSTIFYVTFANEMRELLGLTQNETNNVLDNASRVMRTLDERKESPRKTFERIREFAQFIHAHKGDKLSVVHSSHQLAENLTLHSFVPSCGGTSYVLEHHGALMFVDCGLACYQDEMLAIFEETFENFAERSKQIMITHADIDSTGLLYMFDTAYMTRNCYDNYRAQHKGRQGFRGRRTHQEPYAALGKVITGYMPPQLGRCVAIDGRRGDDLLEPIGSLRFGNWTFELIEGMGGHARGETVIVCPELKLAFTGDLLVNEEHMSEDQLHYNELQSFLMISPDARVHLAEETRHELAERYQGFTICPGHGPAFA